MANPLDGLNFRDCSAEDLWVALKRLKDEGYPEGKDIDYKRGVTLQKKPDDKSGSLDERRTEFLRDVSSFANCHGGYLVLGAEEEEKRPTGFPGFDVESVEKLQQMMENFMQTGIDPRIQGYQIRWLGVEGGKQVAVFKIPASWNPPHMVRFNGWNRFDTRNATGKMDMDVEDLRASFVHGAVLLERFLQFRQQRVVAIKNGEGVFALPDGAKTVIHLIPSSFLREPTILNVETVKGRDDGFLPINQNSEWALMYNFDGVATVFGRFPHVMSYNQWFRHGGFEVADTYLLEERDKVGLVIPHIAFEKYLMKWLELSLTLFDRFSIPAPYCLLVSLLGVKGYRIPKGFPHSNDDREMVTRDELLSPPIMIPTTSMKPHEILHPVFDSIWNASGFPRCMNYNDQGDWVGEARRL